MFVMTIAIFMGQEWGKKLKSYKREIPKPFIYRGFGIFERGA
jgi:hypothetical protein